MRPRGNTFDAGKSIMKASGQGMGPGNQDFFGPCEMASSRQASVIWGPNSQDFQGSTPAQMPSNGFALINSITYRALHTGGP
jgi:hypothetical protein